eukprot:14863315-Alexandrium_andersonii.AAC.1
MGFCGSPIGACWGASRERKPSLGGELSLADSDSARNESKAAQDASLGSFGDHMLRPLSGAA